MELVKWDTVLQLVAGEGLVGKLRKRRWEEETEYAQLRLNHNLEYARPRLETKTVSFIETDNDRTTNPLATAVRTIYHRLGFNIVYPFEFSWPEITLQSSKSPECGHAHVPSSTQPDLFTSASPPPRPATPPATESHYKPGSIFFTPIDGCAALPMSATVANSYYAQPVNPFAGQKLILKSIWTPPAEQPLPPRYLRWFSSPPIWPSETHDYGADADFSSARYHKAVPGWDSDSTARRVLTNLRRGIEQRRLDDNLSHESPIRQLSSASFSNLASSTWCKPLTSDLPSIPLSRSTRPRILWFEARDSSTTRAIYVKCIGFRLRRRVSHFAVAFRLRMRTLPTILEEPEEPKDPEKAKEGEESASTAVSSESKAPNSSTIEKVETPGAEQSNSPKVIVQAYQAMPQLPDSGLVLGVVREEDEPPPIALITPSEADLFHTLHANIPDATFAKRNTDLLSTIKLARWMTEPPNNNNQDTEKLSWRPNPRPRARLQPSHVTLGRRESLLESRFKRLFSEAVELEARSSSHKSLSWEQGWSVPYPSAKFALTDDQTQLSLYVLRKPELS